MVSKNLVSKKIYENIQLKEDLPQMDIEQIAQSLIENPKGIPNFVKYELNQHPVNFRNVMEGTRKDFTVDYTQQIQKAIFREPEVFEGIQFKEISDYETSERITKVDYVSFFTKLKDGSSEHRIYQIGRRYFNKEIDQLRELKEQYQKDQDDSALIEVLNKIIQLDPENLRNYQDLIEIHHKRGNDDKVIELSKQLLLLDGRKYEVWNFLGEVFYKQGDIEKATKLFERALQLYPKFFKALYNLGVNSFLSKDYESAFSFCSTHLEADITEGKIYSKDINRLLEDIIKELRTIINENPDDIEHRMLLGEHYYDKSQFADAKTLFEEVLRNEPMNLDAMVFIGLLYVENVEYEKAIQIYKKVLDLDPEDEVVWDNLGLAYEYNKESIKSIQAFEKAHKLVPEDLEISQHLAIAHLNSQKKNLEVNESGCLSNEEQKSFYTGHLIEFFNKDLINPMIKANWENQDFRLFIETQFPLLISKLQVFYGFEPIKSLITSMIISTKTKITLILPNVLPEILSYCSEYAYHQKEVNLVLISCWDMEKYGSIISNMIMLRNIQIRHVHFNPSFYGVFKDEKELVLAPIIENPNEMLSIQSLDPEFVKFLNQIILPIFNANSRPISP